eukprot:3179381-Alexandrium_andersonii.AAC.1
MPLVVDMHFPSVRPQRVLLRPAPFKRPDDVSRADWASSLEKHAADRYPSIEPSFSAAEARGDTDTLWTCWSET